MTMVSQPLMCPPEEETTTVATLGFAKSVRIAVSIGSVVATLGGNAVPLIAVNMWLLTFPSSADSGGGSNGIHSGAQFAIQFVSAVTFCFVFALLVAASVLLYGATFVRLCAAGEVVNEGPHASTEMEVEPLLPFLRRTPRVSTVWRRVLFAAAMGITDLLSTLLALYATPGTSEVTQAVLQGTICFWAVLVTWLAVKGERVRGGYLRWTLVSSLLLAAGAVGISAIGSSNAGNSPAWVIIFASSAVVYALWSVFQRMYCDLDSSSAAIVAATEAAAALAGPPMFPSLRFRPSHAAAQTVSKLVMLLGDCSFLVVFTVLLIPMDAIPWFGSSRTVGDSFSAFSSAVRCVFSCSDSLQYGGYYCIGYFVSYLGSACLNHFSPTLNSIVILLSAPATALLLLAVPAWNVEGGAPPVWYQQLGGVVLLTLSGGLFYKWEQNRDSESLQEGTTEAR